MSDSQERVTGDVAGRRKPEDGKSPTSSETLGPESSCSACPSSPCRARTAPPVSCCSCCCCVIEEDALLLEEKKLKRRRPVALGTAQVARGWLAGVPPLRVRPTLPFPLPYAPAIKQRSSRGEPPEPSKPEKDADVDFRPAPTCGAEHLVESLFFSAESFFQLPLFQPFLRVCAPDQVVKEPHPEDLRSRTSEEEEEEDMQGDDEEEGEMEEEEDNNELTAYIQRRENRWRRLSTEAIRELEEEHDGNLELAKRCCRRATGQAGGTALDSLDVSAAPQSNGSTTGDGSNVKEDTKSSCPVKTELTREEEKKEPVERREPVKEEDERKEKEDFFGGNLHQELLQDSSFSVKRQDSHQREQPAEEARATRKKKLLLRLEARPTLEDAHRLRVTSESLEALEREGKFR